MSNQAVELIKEGHIIIFRYHHGDWSYAEYLLDGKSIKDDSDLIKAIFEAEDNDLIEKSRVLTLTS